MAALTSLLCALAFLTAASSSQAATLIFADPFYRLDRLAWFPDVQCNAELSGRIYAGDHEGMKVKLEAFFAHPGISGAQDLGANIKPLTLCLEGPGGDLPEAIRISELFRGWNTVVRANTRCVSACAVIFMRALDGFTPFDWPTYIDTSRRYLHPTATLGFHAPDLLIPKDGPQTMTREEALNMAGEMYRRALASVRALVVGVDAERDNRQTRENSEKTFVGYGHFARARLPSELLLAILTTPHQDMYVIKTVEEALHWGIDIFGLPAPKTLTGNMLLVACYNHLHVRCAQGNLNSQCPFESERFESHYYSSQDGSSQGSRGADWYKTVWEEDRITLRRLWPRRDQQSRARDVVVQLFRLNQTSADEAAKKRVLVDPALCAIEAAWQNDRLVGLEIQTMNGNAQESIGAKYAVSTERVKSLLEPRKVEGSAGYPDQLRPWRMLPAGTKLEELAGPDPWGWLAEGGNFFDKAPGW